MKTIGFLLIVSILFSGGFGGFEVHQTQAQFVVKDFAAFFQRMAALYRDVKESWLGEILLIALETAKKRLLDMLVDDIIKWVQEGDLTGSGQGQKFVADWKKYAETAGQEIVGNLAQELEEGFLCKPMQFQVQFALQNRRPFSQRAACTLDMIVENVDAFMKNFNEGGWIAYHDGWAPQNNVLGTTIMLYDEAIIRVLKGKTAAAQEAQASQGFLGVKKCLEYTDKYGDITPEGSVSFETVEKWVKEGDDLVQQLGIKCTKSEIRTPGGIVGAALEKAVGVDFDFIINAKELSQYAAAIIDTLINRVIKEGVKAVKKSGDYTSAEKEETRRRYGPAINDYIGTVQQRDNERKNVFLNRVKESINLLNQASRTLGNASVINNQLIGVLEQLIACQNATSTIIDPNATTALDYASSTKITISQEITKVNNLLTASTRIKTNLENPNFPLADINLNELEEVERNAHTLQLSSETLLSETQGTLKTAQQNLNRCQNP